MAWNLPQIGYRTYKRNPLAGVVAQLKFHPVLKIENDCSGFQDRVRAAFPRFAVANVQDVRVDLTGAHVAQRREFSFATLDQEKSISLGTTSMGLTARVHKSRNDFGRAMAIAVDALTEEYGPVIATRFGLRYINHVSLDAVSDALGRPMSWSDLVHQDFLRLPKGLGDLDGTRYLMEARSTMDRGELTLRYGLIQEANGPVYFRLDTDRYLTEEFDAADTHEMLKGFSRDVYAVFRAAAAPGLEEWMEPLPGGEDA